MKLLLTYALLSFVMFYYSCHEKRKEKHETFANWNIDFEDQSIAARKSDRPYEGKYYTFANYSSQFTYGVTSPIPDSITGYIRVCFDCYARIKKRRYGQSIIVSVSAKDSMLVWHPFNINNYTFNKDKWVHVVDSMQFFKAPGTNGSILKVFGFHMYREGELNIDNLKINLKKITII